MHALHHRVCNASPPPAVLGHYYSQCRCNGMLGDLLKARQRSGDRIISDRVRFLLTLIDEYLLGRARIRILEVGCNSGGLLSELKAALHASDLPAPMRIDRH
ncbi:hypothetical protein ACPA9J_12610 [Pseudomonas aeruginosa]